MRSRFITHVVAACFFAFVQIDSGNAQEAYPSRAVKLLVPFVAASPSDVLARLLASKLADQWRKPVIVENKPGASGSIGVDSVAKAPADGYTLLVTADFPLTMYPAVAKQLPYNPVSDFKPIATVAYTDNGLFVNSSTPAHSVEELVALARAQPGKLTFASAGTASPSHFAAEQLMAVTGVSMIHVPYKGGVPGVTALVTGEVSMTFASIPIALAQVRAGKIRVLAVTGTKPSPLLPGVKPLVDQGFPDLVISNWFPVLAPARTPDAVTEAVRTALRKALDDPEVRTRMDASGLTPTFEGPEHALINIESATKRWADVARRAKIQAE